MRIYQASPARWAEAIAIARNLRCSGIAWTLGEETKAVIEQTRSAGLSPHGFVQAARDPEAMERHPEWMHAPPTS